MNDIVCDENKMTPVDSILAALSLNCGWKRLSRGAREERGDRKCVLNLAVKSKLMSVPGCCYLDQISVTVRCLCISPFTSIYFSALLFSSLLFQVHIPYRRGLSELTE